MPEGRELKLGKKPATHDPRDLAFNEYRIGPELPRRPRTFGSEGLVKEEWGMLGNDTAGDCVWAGAAHEHMLWCATAGTVTTFAPQDVLAAYSAVTGYIPGEDSTDKGTNVRDALDFRRSNGIRDTEKVFHKIGAYVRLEPGNTDHLFEALYLFGTVGIGIQFPESAMEQFDNGQPWKPVRGAQISGGHYIPLVAKRAQLICVTWGQLQAMTTAFYKKYCDEAWGILSEDMLRDNSSALGFDFPALQADLNQLGTL